MVRLRKPSEGNCPGSGVALGANKWRANCESHWVAIMHERFAETQVASIHVRMSIKVFAAHSMMHRHGRKTIQCSSDAA